ncbi:hypothetical protein A2U01_0055414, partial [Trifolium medium]|nr:hypothetical protein [Trifolium medium]
MSGGGYLHHLNPDQCRSFVVVCSFLFLFVRGFSVREVLSSSSLFVRSGSVGGGGGSSYADMGEFTVWWWLEVLRLWWVVGVA